MITRRESLQWIGLAGLGSPFLTAGCSGASGEPEITFANPAPVWWNAVPLIASSHDLYSAQKVRVRAFDVATGVKSKEAIVAGNAQAGVSSPNALSITSDADLARLKILASITQSSSTVALLSRRPMEDLTKTRIGYVRGAISEFYLVAYLMQTNQLDRYLSRQLDLVALPPPSLVTAFDKSDVDAVAAWEPFASQIESSARAKGEVLHVVRDKSLYTQHIFALASTEALARSKEAVQRLLKALREASLHIEGNRPLVAAELEKSFSFPAGFLAKSPVWPDVAFRFETSRPAIRTALLRDLELARHARVGQASEAGLDGALSEL